MRDKKDSLRYFTTADVEQFERDGYLFPVPIISEKQANDCRAVIEQWEAKLGRPLQGAERVAPHLIFEWADRIMRHPVIVDCIRDLIGPDVLCWNSVLWVKEANSSSYVSWHQDNQYWGLDTSRLVSAWLALSPASLESGCMRVLPGSHLGEPMVHQDLYHKDNLLTRGQEILDVDENLALSMPLRTGEMSFHNVRIAHASTPNSTNDRRIGLSIQYVPAGTRQIEADWDCATLICGEDRYGYLEHAPVPRYDFDPITMDYHKKSTDALRELLFRGADQVRSTV